MLVLTSAYIQTVRELENVGPKFGQHTYCQRIKGCWSLTQSTYKLSENERMLTLTLVNIQTVKELKDVGP